MDIVISVVAFCLGLFVFQLCMRHKGHFLSVAYVTVITALMFVTVTGEWQLWGNGLHWLAWILAFVWLFMTYEQWDAFWERRDNKKKRSELI